MNRILPALLLTTFVTFGLFVNAQTSHIRVLTARKICTLQDARINESSGLAASQCYAKQNLLWTLNDSGGEPEIFCVNLQGETVATVRLDNATNVDWEDIAVAGDWIYIADTGDNFRRRDYVVVYRLREPKFDPKSQGQSLTLTCEKMILRYPAGARDCETLLAFADGRVLLVSKNGGASIIYRAPTAFRDGSSLLLEQVGEYSFTGTTAWSYLTTGGSVSGDGKRLVIRTYTHAYEWPVPETNDGKTIWKNAPSSFALPLSQQGESIAYAADSSRIFTGSEGEHSPIFEIPLRHEVTQ